MSKEEIIEEIKLNVVYIIFRSDKLEEVIDLWLSKAINQTREETIRECDGVLPEENYGHEDNCSTEYKNGWNDCREEIKQSLINLRSK